MVLLIHLLFLGSHYSHWTLHLEDHTFDSRFVALVMFGIILIVLCLKVVWSSSCLVCLCLLMNSRVFLFRGLIWLSCGWDFSLLLTHEDADVRTNKESLLIVWLCPDGPTGISPRYLCKMFSTVTRLLPSLKVFFVMIWVSVLVEALMNGCLYSSWWNGQFYYSILPLAFGTVTVDLARSYASACVGTTHFLQVCFQMFFFLL